MKIYLLTLIRTERYTAIVALDDDIKPDRLTPRERESIIDNGVHTELCSTSIELGDAVEMVAKGNVE